MAAALAGCSAIDRLTGSTDNTVLPGQREEAIPGRAQFPENGGAPQGSTASAPPSADAGTATTASGTNCAPDDASCAPPSGDDTFSDPQ